MKPPAITNFTALLLAISILAPAFEAAAAMGTTRSEAAALDGKVSRTRAEVEALIEKAGQTPLEWFASVSLNYPKTLDLTWGEPRGRNAQKDLSEYIWTVINPNENRWREGVKLLHQTLIANKNDREAQFDHERAGHCLPQLFRRLRPRGVLVAQGRKR